jgi:hypothetical protein
MPLRHRRMQPSDVGECARVVRSHPVFGARYGDTIRELGEAWLRSLNCEAISAVVFDELTGPNARIWGVGVSVFVTDSFLKELKTPPFFWVGRELVKRILRGESPLLSDKQLREANVHGGLNLVVWEGCILPEDATRPEVYNKLMATFMDEHRGFLWKEIIASQAETVERFGSMLKSGGMLWHPVRCAWTDAPEEHPKKIISRPHVIGLTREIEERRPGSWAGTLFDYSRPQFGFRPSEQRLLLAALRGRTDEELGADLGVSLSAVKKTWRAIYDRVSAQMPGLIPVHSPGNPVAQDRGKEKKQHLTAYLREHPEELRPVSRSLLSARPKGAKT